ncbi:uncharacterized protein MELLADRAFT_111034 [Melampsora larici-populina 98AG31]|uniref:Uncharacterized protein n=1 Tax=Melampsora larici-populina (strain 98AG31 / pathotype 3-4-7) TaxID=747676 RepID=F4S1T9_MELLP|nr:uncharacterized protein MELLADRAFT_111034 [Melampsora larici-populina 98AG31]EGG01433.1 hypothetical protein MELLADRAFT_111034 [Melampsora larici-populina 98AG31]
MIFEQRFESKPPVSSIFNFLRTSFVRLVDSRSNCKQIKRLEMNIEAVSSVEPYNPSGEDLIDYKEAEMTDQLAKDHRPEDIPIPATAPESAAKSSKFVKPPPLKLATADPLKHLHFKHKEPVGVSELAFQSSFGRTSTILQHQSQPKATPREHPALQMQQMHSAMLIDSASIPAIPVGDRASRPPPPDGPRTGLDARRNRLTSDASSQLRGLGESEESERREDIQERDPERESLPSTALQTYGLQVPYGPNQQLESSSVGLEHVRETKERQQNLQLSTLPEKKPVSEPTRSIQRGVSNSHDQRSGESSEELDQTILPLDRELMNPVFHHLKLYLDPLFLQFDKLYDEIQNTKSFVLDRDANKRLDMVDKTLKSLVKNINDQVSALNKVSFAVKKTNDDMTECQKDLGRWASNALETIKIGMNGMRDQLLIHENENLKNQTNAIIAAIEKINRADTIHDIKQSENEHDTYAKKTSDQLSSMQGIVRQLQTAVAHQNGELALMRSHNEEVIKLLSDLTLHQLKNQGTGLQLEEEVAETRLHDVPPHMQDVQHITLPDVRRANTTPTPHDTFLTPDETVRNAPAEQNRQNIRDLAQRNPAREESTGPDLTLGLEAAHANIPIQDTSDKILEQCPGDLDHAVRSRLGGENDFVHFSTTFEEVVRRTSIGRNRPPNRPNQDWKTQATSGSNLPAKTAASKPPIARVPGKCDTCGSTESGHDYRSCRRKSKGINAVEIDSPEEESLTGEEIELIFGDDHDSFYDDGEYRAVQDGSFEVPAVPLLLPVSWIKYGAHGRKICVPNKTGGT